MALATFLVEIDVDDLTPNGLIAEADDIMDDLESAGHAVTSVKPWERPTLTEGTIQPLFQPPPTL